MTSEELEQLRELLVKFSASTEDHEGALRDDVGFVIFRVDERLDDAD